MVSTNSSMSRGGVSLNIARVGCMTLAILTALQSFCGIPSMLLAQPAATDREDASDNSAHPPENLQKRVLWTDSRVFGSPEPPLPFYIERIFGQLQFDHPLFLIREPNSDRLYVIEQEGKIFQFNHDRDSKDPSLFFDAGRVTYSLCFHPRYAENGYIYIFTNGKVDGGNHNRISRYTVARTPALRLDPDSELLILEYPSSGHNGHHLLFGPDGYLYITSGDGTSGMDPKLDAQDISNLRGTVIRIDVDHPVEDRPYSIPRDNPFVDREDARGEIWAFGFRNPFRMQFDPATGALWVADIGQDAWEMIHWVRRGSNAGWSLMEGSHPLNLQRPRGPAPITPPIVEHPHAEMRSITGGYFYRGNRFPELQGAYLYGDYDTGKIWAVRYDYQRKKISWQKELADTSIRVLSIDPDRDGEPIIVDYGEGRLYQLKRTPPETTHHDFPTRLSETGLFDDVARNQFKPGVIPYSVNSPLWSDGAIKERYIALPGESQIVLTGPKERRGWTFEQGAVLVKTFILEMEAGNSESRRRIETRLLTLQTGPQGGEWIGYSYRWNQSQSDALLVAKGGADVTYRIGDAAAPDSQREQTWHFPSRAECMSCHTREARYTLGLTTLQMNRRHHYGEYAENQLRVLERLEIFTKALPLPPDELPRLVDPYDASYPLEQRARSYLHVNCSNCHVANGGGNSEMILDYLTDREKMEILDVPPQHQKFGLPDPRLIASGFPERSIILQRVSRRGRDQMPPLGSALVDQRAVKLLTDWVKSLENTKDPSN